jgi:hypothetical protein
MAFRQIVHLSRHQRLHSDEKLNVRNMGKLSYMVPTLMCLRRSTLVKSPINVYSF